MNQIQNVIHDLLFSCEKAAFLLDMQEVESLSSCTKWRLKLHSMICKSCNAYKLQTEFISKVLVKLKNNDDHTKFISEGKCLCNKTKAELQARMEVEINKKR